MSSKTEELTYLTNPSELISNTSPMKNPQNFRSSPKLINQNIRTLINKSNKYLLETNTLLQKTKSIFTDVHIKQNSKSNSVSNNKNSEAFENFSQNQFKMSFSPQYSFNNLAPSFETVLPSSKNPSFSSGSLSKFRNFAFVLSLNEKNLTKLSPDLIMNKTNLQILELKNNKLKSVPEEIFLLPNLKCLKLDANYIKEIPPELCKSLRQLEILSFYDNIIGKLPSEIRFWKDSLIYLNIAENHLDSLPEEIGQLTKLNSLRIEHNHFIYLPMSIVNLTNLKEFGLDWFKYCIPVLKLLQHWKLAIDEIAMKFYSLKRAKLEIITFELFINQFSLNKKNIKTHLTKERTFTHKAALENDIGVLRALVTLEEANLNKLDSEDQTALFLSIRNENYLASKVLLHNGANPKIGGGVLGSCLNLATAKCQFYLVSDLLRYGADVNKCDVDGNNSLHVLMCLFDSDTINYRKIAELLLAYGLNPNALNQHKWGAVHLAIKRGQNEGVKWILDYNETKKSELINNNNDGFERSDESPLEIFNLNMRGGDEKLTPLHLAVMQNNILLVESLIEKGKIDIFLRSRNEKLASSLAIQNLFLFKILRTYERKDTQIAFINPLIKEKKLKALGKDLNMKSEAEVSDDSSETRTFQKVKDLNQATNDKRVFSQRGHTTSASAFGSSNEHRSLYFNKFNVENYNAIPIRTKPLKPPTQDSLNETQISDMEENKSDIDIAYELEGQWGKNMRSFFGSPNNIRSIDALQKVNHLINKIKPQKNPKAQSIYSKNIAMNHLKVLTDHLNDIVDNLKKGMKTCQEKILDLTNCLAQKVKFLNGVLLFHYKINSLINNYTEEKKLVEQIKRLIDKNPHLASLKYGEKLIFESIQPSSIFFNQTHSSLALRWLVYLFMNLPSRLFFENIVLKLYIIKLFANFFYQNSSSYLQTILSDRKESLVLRFEAFQTLKGFNISDNLLKEVSKNLLISINMSNSSLKPVSLEASKEIGTEKMKNFGSSYFSNKKQNLRKENVNYNRNEIQKKSENYLNQNMITINSAEIEDGLDDKPTKSLFDELKQNQKKKIIFNSIMNDDEKKYNIEGFREKENKEMTEAV